MIGGGVNGGTTITGGGGGGTKGGGDTGGTLTDGSGGGLTKTGGGTIVTGGLIGHDGGKNAAAGGDHTANGTAVSDTVTAGSNFFSPFFNRLWLAMIPSLRSLPGSSARAACAGYFGYLVHTA
jgi:hypothetical protein